ncbi:MAG: hypothetical protein ALMCE001_02780 [Methanocorpusculum sp. MCE]|nr:MAG: hypothetical protein ALMCE001_02780 [Methanocorpusculum sp. MCE]
MEKEIIIGMRRGADWICPNGPDEGTSRWVERIDGAAGDLS